MFCKMNTYFFLISLIAMVLLNPIESYSRPYSRCNNINSKSTKHTKLSMSLDRKAIIKKILGPLFLSSVLLSAPQISNAYFNDAGEWVELKESGVTEVWAERLKKASTMKPSEIFMAAKGAGNNDKRIGPESTASRKRRAMAGCRTSEYRNLIPGGLSELNCNVKVNKGDIKFMLDILDTPVKKTD